MIIFISIVYSTYIYIYILAQVKFGSSVVFAAPCQWLASDSTRLSTCTASLTTQHDSVRSQRDIAGFLGIGLLQAGLLALVPAWSAEGAVCTNLGENSESLCCGFYYIGTFLNITTGLAETVSLELSFDFCCL